MIHWLKKTLEEGVEEPSCSPSGSQEIEVEDLGEEELGVWSSVQATSLVALFPLGLLC